MPTAKFSKRISTNSAQLLFIDDGAVYNGKAIKLLQKIQDTVQGLQKSCSSFLGAVAIPRWEEPEDISRVPGVKTWKDYLRSGTSEPPAFARVPFNEPLLICHSSGTTGIPKAIVHSVGGICISIFKEGGLHEDLKSDSVTLQYTTTGWIMYLSSLKPLLFGSRVIFYDGSPFQPDLTVLLRVVEQHKVTKLGISPRWLFELAKRGISPREIADISSLQTVTSTGMVLSEQLFGWFYDTAFPAYVHLANISGGTDIVSVPLNITFKFLTIS